MSQRALRLLWALAVLAAFGHLAWRIAEGPRIGTDLLALVPHEESDADLAAARARVEANLAGRLFIMVGHPDAATARRAAGEFAEALGRSPLVREVSLRASDGMAQQLGALYFPHRFALLAPADRERLLAGAGEELRDRALAQIFGLGMVAGQGLLASDPFLLLPAFFQSMPAPADEMRLIDGLLTREADGRTYILFTARAEGSAFALGDQTALVHQIGAIQQSLAQTHAGLSLHRAGALFHAEAGGRRGLQDAERIGLLSLIGAISLYLLVFRRLRQLLFSLLSVATGLGVALSVSFALFGELHVVAIMFGASLIGVSVDYAVHYFVSGLDESAGAPGERLRRILPGLSLGLATSLAGYLALLLAPLPGLHQVAAISSLGLIGAFLTVVLWLPVLDRAGQARPAPALLRRAHALWRLWHEPARRPAGRALLLAIIAAALAGSPFLRTNDDVRQLQSLDPALVEEEAEIRRLSGRGPGGAYFLVFGENGEQALARAEALEARIAPLQREGVLKDLTSAADFLPSPARQAENRRLVRERLIARHLGEIEAATGLRTKLDGEGTNAPLALAPVADLNPLLASLLLDPDGRMQLALPGAVHDAARLRAATADLEGVRFVDPARDISGLFALYRERALWLVAIATFLIGILLATRYGMAGALQVMAPPVLALLATPPILALFGHSLTFFSAMALLLVLAIGMDYALFSRETRPGHEAATMLAILVAGATTLLSFGLLGLSGTLAVRSFGTTMLTGITLAILLAPLAGRWRR
ncbi:MAG: hypothetical protein KIT81_13025 [Alphaproteobacteria bacterium]|nr:hypothetical protein [Alphaproteobacteria bacterium]